MLTGIRIDSEWIELEMNKTHKREREDPSLEFDGVDLSPLPPELILQWSSSDDIVELLDETTSPFLNFDDPLVLLETEVNLILYRSEV